MNETIGKNIRLLREYNNMSQQELADKLYITRQSISKWESGLVAPDLEKLLKMSELFNVKIDDLLNDNFIINISYSGTWLIFDGFGAICDVWNVSVHTY